MWKLAHTSSCLENGVDFGHTTGLPNEAAQWATIYGIMNPTHRRSHQGILVTLLNNSWLHLLGDPTGHSVNRLSRGNFFKSFYCTEKLKTHADIR